jgi:streptogramin lyase
VWYSDYAAGFLGKLDPATSEVKEWASPAVRHRSRMASR